MITDKLGTYCEKLDFFSTAVSDILDHGAADYKLGGGAANKYLEIVVTEDFATATSEEFILEASDAEDMSSPVQVISTGAIAIADLVVGKHIRYPLPSTAGRYTRLKNAEVGTTGTAGKISAYVTY